MKPHESKRINKLLEIKNPLNMDKVKNLHKSSHGKHKHMNWTFG